MVPVAVRRHHGIDISRVEAKRRQLFHHLRMAQQAAAVDQRRLRPTHEIGRSIPGVGETAARDLIQFPGQTDCHYARA